jgi:hypothetical protein
MSTINNKQLELAIRISLDADIPVCVWGASGIGKSTIIEQATRSFFADIKADVPMFCNSEFASVKIDKLGPQTFYDLRLAHTDTADWGIPVVDRQYMTHTKTRPSWIPASLSGIYVLFADELNRGTQEGINAMMSITAERRLGEYKLPPVSRLLSACNPPTGEFNTDTLDKAMKARWSHVHYALDTNSFLESRLGHIDPAFSFILNNSTDLIEGFQNNQLTGTWSVDKEVSPCPRTIEILARLAAWCMWWKINNNNQNITDDLREAIIALASGLVKANLAFKWFQILNGRDWLADASFYNGKLEAWLRTPDVSRSELVGIYFTYRNLIPNMSQEQLDQTKYLRDYAKKFVPEFYEMINLHIKK